VVHDGDQQGPGATEKALHIWRTQAHAIAEPAQELVTNADDKELEEIIRLEVSDMQHEANGAEDWTPTKKDVAIMIKYLREAYTKRTAQGPDDITPDLILFADEIMLDCLLALLTLMAAAASSPDAWRGMYMVMCRDPQDLLTGYRPICIGPLVLLAWTNSKLDLIPRHPAIMAYTKGTGHDMGIFTATGAMLHMQYEARVSKKPMPRKWAIGTDVENAFNGTWRELVEWIE
jgi:hypothetical protein